ncbi:MAG: FAD-dependent oxidoreductase, partial [Desulfocucumaceae bacterium]
MGIEAGGVFTFRNIKDLRRIQNHLEKNSRVVIMGGGFIGLKVAEALIHLGNSVTVLEKLPRLLPRMLDEPAAALLENHLQRSGVRLNTGMGAREVLAREGRVCGIVTDSGDTLEADMLIVAVGVRPSVGLVKGRLETRAGIL